MKTKFLILAASLVLNLNSQADPGTINFLNSSTTRVSLQHPLLGDLGYTPTAPGGFTYQLFIAPAGTTDPLQFTATNVRGTNSTAVGGAGRFQGGFQLEVNGVQAGESRSILVRGWSSSLGDDYAEALSHWNPFLHGFLGESSIAPNFYFGGFDGTGPIPASPAFGGAFGIQSGFALVGVPEPTVAALVCAGIITLTSRRRFLSGEKQ